MANPRRVQIDRSTARTYHGKAKQLCQSASQTFSVDQYDAAVVLAIHAGINACDSVCIGLVGLRSNDPDHEKAADLLRTIGAKGTFDDEANRLMRLLKLKNRIEYDNKRATRDDADQCIRRCTALVKWADAQLLRAGL